MLSGNFFFFYSFFFFKLSARITRRKRKPPEQIFSKISLTIISPDVVTLGICTKSTTAIQFSVTGLSARARSSQRGAGKRSRITTNESNWKLLLIALRDKAVARVRVIQTELLSVT